MKSKKIIFTIENPDVKAAYLHLKEDQTELRAGEAVHQIKIDSFGVEGNESLKNGELIVDLNSEGKIIGIEILGDLIPKNLIG